MVDGHSYWYSNLYAYLFERRRELLAGTTPLGVHVKDHRDWRLKHHLTSTKQKSKRAREQESKRAN